MVRGIRSDIGRRVERLAECAEPGIRDARWLAASLVIGVVPFSLSLATGLLGHQLAAAALLAWLCLGCARSDQWQKGVSLLALTFAAHSLAVIVASACWPEQCAVILPGAAPYWKQQLAWIQTGNDPEYAWQAWLSRHVLLISMSLVWSFLSLGVQTFARGFMEVDLMNYYNAQLWIHSTNPTLTFALGWHLWSILRGIGFLFITYEVISLALQYWTGRELVVWKLRRLRIGLALGFFVADGLTKQLLMEAVRQGLHDHLAAL